jgi:hypothetical protein
MKRLFPGLVVALLVSGCNSPCVQLATEVCQCQPTQQARDNCNSVESGRNSQVNPSSESEDICQSLIPLCDCALIGTPEGKKNCGMADFFLPDGGVLPLPDGGAE